MVESTVIPEDFLARLAPFEPRFVLNKPRGKKPYEKGWNTYSKARELDDRWFRQRLEKGYNYGVLVDHGLIVIDADDSSIFKVIEEKLPPTLVVKSGRRDGGQHYYFHGDWVYKKTKVVLSRRGLELGHFSGSRTQVVGPGSMHHTGSRYRVLHDRPVAAVDPYQIEDVLAEFIGVVKPDLSKFVKEATRERADSVLDISILDVVNTSGMREQSDEFYGVHPVHGSDHGQNFWVNPAKNAWHCFRHDTGGGPLQWLAVAAGLLDCKEAVPGALRGDKFLAVLEEARRRKLLPEQSEPVEALPYDSAEALYDELYDYFVAHLDLIDDDYYHVLVAWTFASWNIDNLKTIAYLMFRGLKKSGKSRALDTLELVCYNPENCGFITRAAMNRILLMKTSTFFLDEFDKMSDQKLQDFLPILNSGYTRRKFAVMCDKDDPTKVIRLPCFGPKAIALVKGTDDAFTSRCIQVPMYQNTIPVNYEIDEVKGAELKSKLKQWQEDRKGVVSSTKHLYLGEDVQKPVRDYRVVQMFEPLTTSVPVTKRAKLLKYAKKLDNAEISEEMDELYREIYEIVKALFAEGDGAVKLVLLKEVRDLYNAGKNLADEDYMNPKASGSYMNSMGFTDSRRTKGGMGRMVTSGVMDRLARRFERGQQTHD